MSAKRTGFILAALMFTLVMTPVAKAWTIRLTDFQAVVSSVIDPETGNETVSLLVHSARFGPGGFAGGTASVRDQPPDDNLWLVDPFLGNPPDDSTPALSFLLNPGGTVMGIEPSPFRLFLANPSNDNRPVTLIGELDFSDVTGTSGSLNLSGVKVLAVDENGDLTGEVFDIYPFTIQFVQAIPEPSTLLLAALSLLSLGMTRRRRRR